MEIPACKFFTFWAFTSLFSLFLGFEALDNTDLPNSISPVAMSFLKISLAVSAFNSSTYALVFRPKLRISVGKYYAWLSFAVSPIFFSGITGESFAWYFSTSLINLFAFLLYFFPDMQSFIPRDQFDMLKAWSFFIALFPPVYFCSRGESLGYLPIFLSNFLIILQIPFTVVSEEQLGIHLHFLAVSSLFLFGGKITKYFPVLVLVFSLFTSVSWAVTCGDERFRKWLPAAAAAAGENRILSNLKKMMKKKGKVIEFAIGMAGTILFQNFFRLTSFDHVVVFLYLAVAWLANIAMLLTSHDLGVFNFLLSNVIVGCTVSQFGLRGTTWLAYGATLVLYILRLQLEDLSLVKRGEDEVAVIVWGEQRLGQEFELWRFLIWFQFVKWIKRDN